MNLEIDGISKAHHLFKKDQGFIVELPCEVYSLAQVYDECDIKDFY